MTRAAAILNDTEVKRSPAILALETELGLDPIAKDYETDYAYRKPALDIDRALAVFFHGGHLALDKYYLDRVW
jgi:hypothetical protein